MNRKIALNITASLLFLTSCDNSTTTSYSNDLLTDKNSNPIIADSTLKAPEEFENSVNYSAEKTEFSFKGYTKAGALDI